MLSSFQVHLALATLDGSLRPVESATRRLLIDYSAVTPRWRPVEVQILEQLRVKCIIRPVGKFDGRVGQRRCLVEFKLLLTAVR